MPFIQTVTSGLLSRHTAKRVARVIPNPILRYILVTAATAVVPLIVNRAAKQWRTQRARRNARQSARGSTRHAHQSAHHTAHHATA